MLYISSFGHHAALSYLYIQSIWHLLLKKYTVNPKVHHWIGYPSVGSARVRLGEGVSYTVKKTYQ